MNSGFIAIEGLEGAGKTNAVTQVLNILHQQGIRDVICTREPGGTPLAEALRQLIKKGVGDELITDYAELLMLYAARVQVIERVIKPALSRGTWVISDRCDLSAQAYQGGGRGVDIHLLQTLRTMILGNFYPDLILYLDISQDVGLVRARARGKSDRIEVESLAFFERTRTCYQALAEENERIITIDATQPLVAINSEIRTHLMKWLHTQKFFP